MLTIVFMLNATHYRKTTTTTQYFKINLKLQIFLIYLAFLIWSRALLVCAFPHHFFWILHIYSSSESHRVCVCVFGFCIVSVEMMMVPQCVYLCVWCAGIIILLVVNNLANNIYQAHIQASYNLFLYFTRWRCRTNDNKGGGGLST